MKMKLGEVLRFKAALASKVGSCPVCLHCIQCHKATQNDYKSIEENAKLPEKSISKTPKSITSSTPEDENFSMMDDQEKVCASKTGKFLTLNVDNSSTKNLDGNEQDVNKETDEDE